MQATPSEGTRPADRAARDVGVELVMRLDALLKTMRLYGPEHPRRNLALQELAGAAEKALSSRDRIGVLARKDAVTVYVGEGFHTIESSLAPELLQRSIRYLQILAGAKSMDFEVLASILAMKPEEVKAGGGAPAMLRAAGIARLEGIEFRCEEDGQSIGDLSPDEIMAAVNRMLDQPAPDGKKPDPARIEALQQVLTEGEISAELATLCSFFGSLHEGEEEETRTIDLFELLIREVAGLEFPSDANLDEGTKHVLERLLGMLKGKVLERMFGSKGGSGKRRPIAEEVREAGGVLPLFLGRAGLSDLVGRTRGSAQAKAREAATAAPQAQVGISFAGMNRLANRNLQSMARPAPTSAIPAAEIPERVRAILEKSGAIRLDPSEVIDGTLGVADELKQNGLGGTPVARIVRSVANFIEKLDEPRRASCLDVILDSPLLDGDDAAGGGSLIIGDLLFQSFDPRAVVLRILERRGADPAACRNRLRMALRGATAEIFFDLAGRLEPAEDPAMAALLRDFLAEMAEKGLLPEIERRVGSADPPEARKLYALFCTIPSPGCRRIVVEAARTASPEKRAAALRSIATSGGEEDLAPVLEATSEKSPALRHLAISLLATRQDVAAVRRLCEIASAEKLLGGNQEDRLLAIDTLARQGALPGLEVLREIAERRSLLAGIGSREVRDKAREALTRALAERAKKSADRREKART